MQVVPEAYHGCLKINIPQYNSWEMEGKMEVFGLKDMGSNSVDNVSNGKVAWEASPLSNQCYSRPLYRQNFSWPYVYPNYQMLQQPQQYVYGNHVYQIPGDYNFLFESPAQHVPFKVQSTGYFLGGQLQEFDYFVVIDFEATCDKGKNLQPQEIIEFPSVLVNGATQRLEASFQTYVRPTHHQLLTEFCKELTGIQQIHVDKGVSLNEALVMHDRWLQDKGIKDKKFAVVTWSDWDCRVMLESECRLKKIKKPPYFDRWINLKVPFQQVFGGVRCNLKQAVELAGLSWEGRCHCGLDDARNTARLLALLIQRGLKLSITNSLGYQPNISASQTSQECSLASKWPPNTNCMDPRVKNDPVYCYCGVPSSRCVIRKPGPMQGRCFLGCGKWTATRGAACNYFVWASP